MTTPGFERRHIVPAGELPLDRLAPLFEACFSQPFDAAWWRWKYRAARNPSLALIEDGRAMAHYGGMPRPLWMFGERVAGMQVGDVMVHPEARGGLGRRGPFFILAASFLAREVGFGLPALVAFGFPNLRALRLGEALGLYAAVDSVTELRWPAAPLPLAARRADAADASLAEAIDRLWATMKLDLRAMVAGERDAAWWRERYAEHPAAPYATWLLERPEPALLVLRAHGEEALEWIDFIGPLDAFAAARDAARAIAAAEGRREVFAWLSSSAAARVRDAAAIERNIEVGVPTCVHTPGPAPETLRGRWWLMGGDTDFR